MFDLEALLGGPRPMFVNPGRLSQQLETELPSDVANLITSLAAAFDATLIANPAIGALLTAQQAQAVAGLYGAMQGAINSTLTRTDLPEEVRARFAATNEQLAQIVRLAQIDLAPPAASQGTPEDTFIETVLADALAGNAEPVGVTE